MKLFTIGALSTALLIGPALPAAAADPKPVPGFDGKIIKLGVVGPLTGPTAVLGGPVAAGNDLYFKKVNDRGGIAGKYKVELLLEDHENLEAKAVQRYAKLKDDVVMFAQFFGTHTTSAIQPQLRADKVVAAPTSFDNFWVRDPNLLPVGSTYQIMAANAVDYWHRTEGKPESVVCGMIRKDPYGEAGLEGLKVGAEKVGRKVATVVNFSLPDQDFTGQISQLQAAKCDLVYVTTIPGQFARIVGNAARVNFTPRWVAQWPSWHAALIKGPAIDYIEKHVWLAGEGPEWGDVGSPGMVELIADIKKYKPDQQPDVWFVYGYNQARAVTAVLERAAAEGDLSRDGVMKALTEMPNVDFGGLTGPHRYGAIAARELPRVSSIFAIDRHKPFGLKALQIEFSSEAARGFTF
jgi:ABC-type branched-subunit amino acid transport system substrate-binding protein